MSARAIVLALLALAPLASVSAAAQNPAVSSVTERGEDGVIFVIEVPPLIQTPVQILGESFVNLGAPGFGTTAEPGLPALPFRTFTIAVPPDRDPVPRITVLASETLDLVPAPAPEPTMEMGGEDDVPVPGIRDAVDRAFYSGGSTYPVQLFEARPLSWLRQQQVFDLTVYPVRYDAGARQVTVHRRLEVRVDFRSRAGLRSAPERLSAPTYERGFESIYKHTLINYESARSFRAGPRLDALEGRGTGPRDDPELKIKLATTGPVRLTFEQLARRGLPAGIAIDQLAMAERRYVDGPPPTDNFARDPVPIEVSDPNQNGIFDAGDAITFYARRYRDRVGPDPYLHRFTETNLVWLSWSDPGGARIGQRPGWLPDPATPAAASFPDTFHFEEDLKYVPFSPRTHPVEPLESRETVLPWYLAHSFPSDNPNDPYCASVPPNHPDARCRAFLFPFTLGDVDESQPARARVQMVSDVDGFFHLGTFLLTSGASVDTLASRWSFGPSHFAIGRWESDPFPASLLTRPGSNFKFRGERRATGDTEIISLAGASFDWFEFAYGHLYQARGDRILCSSGAASGPTEFRITNFSNRNIDVYDVTDFLNPTLLTGVQVSGAGPYEVRFRDDVTGPRRYAVFARQSGELVLTDSAIAFDPPSTLANPGVEPDYIIVVSDISDLDGDGAIDDFPAEVERLKDHRTSLGHRVQTALLSDIYDEFDGGLARPLAIRNYLRYAFGHWTRPPQYLLLAGDGSEDFRDKLVTGINVVPTQMFFGPVTGERDLELVSCDTWFVAGLGETDREFDLHLDMTVGRLPGHSPAELRLMIDKTIAYENFEPGDRWRAKTLTISDDAWSSTISFGAPYLFRSNERAFEYICDSLNAIVRTHSGLGDLIDIRAMDLSFYTDQLPDSEHTQENAQNIFDELGSPVLYDLISEGNVIMNYQGHANRLQMAHEKIFNSFVVDADYNSFNNLGRPGIWFIYACHPNEFEAFDERPGVRTIGELLLAKPNSGLVASVGSSGFELLPFNQPGGYFRWDLNTPQWEAFFLTPPEPSLPGEPPSPRWILGPVNNLAKELYNQRDSHEGPIFTYCLLGDPALRVDAIPPRFEVAAADTARAAGDRIESFTAKSDTVTVTADIRDEVFIALAEVRERTTGGKDVPVDPALWRVESVDDPDTTVGRHVFLTYDAPLRPDDYDIILSARDANGRLVEFPLQVRVDASFRADGNPLAPGDFLAPKAEIEIDLHAPVSLIASDFSLLLDDAPLPGLQAQPRDPLAKDWRLNAAIQTGTGSHRLGLQIRHDGLLALNRSVDFQVSTSLSLRQVGAYPNPFDTFTAFTYQLTDPADELLIRIYTISGRLVRELTGPRTVGFSQVAWDGRDADRNEVANGLYIFRVLARGPSDKDDFTGRLVRARR